MSDFLDRMASRSQGAAPVLRPRLLSLFEGGPELFEEVHVERDAPLASRSTAPPRTHRRPAQPTAPGRPADASRDPAPEPWREAAPARAVPPLASNRPRLGPDEPLESPLPPAAGGAAAQAPSVEPTPGFAPRAGGPIPAAIVRRRAAEVPAAPSAEWGPPEPRPDAAEMANLAPDAEPAPTPARLAASPGPEEPRPGVSSAEWGPPAPHFAAAAAAGPTDREAAPEPAPGSPPARTLDAAPRPVPPRPGTEVVAPVAIPTHFAVPPFAPRSEAAPAPAPVEIRIGRIDIHAAPPAAPAAPVAAPGPSLDAFLARPRR